MGILDDAIREHLELKRKHGAAGSDVDRLEQEAFGPAERPGEADSEAEQAPPSPDDEVVEELRAAEHGADAAEQPDRDADWLEELDLGPAEVEPAEPRTPAEQARIEHSHLEDTADHPTAPGEAAEAGEAEEAVPPEPPEAAIFDQGEGEEEEAFDLELELPEDAAGEHPLPPQAESGQGSDVDASEQDEDLLEETPDFLEDAPEDERLWFERRGEPKDFDFDD